MSHVEETATGNRSTQRELTHRAYRRSLGLTVLGTVVPGAGLTRTRRRAFGWLLVAGFVVVMLMIIALLVFKGPTGAALAVTTRPRLLRDLSIAAIVIGLLWCLSIITTAWLTRPQVLDKVRTATHGALTCLLVLVIAAPAWWVHTSTRATADAFGTIFDGDGSQTGPEGIKLNEEDPWKDVKRVNILLVGSDAGPDRTGLRPDSLIVASMNPQTAETTLIGIPRNLQRVPFSDANPLKKVFPNGYHCPDRGPGNECLINAIWTEATERRADLFKDKKNPGLWATRDAIESATALKINYSVVIDLEGFEDLVNAMGGVDINVKVPENRFGWTALPLGAWHDGTRLRDVPAKSETSEWLQPGVQHLNGHQALWYARLRVIDDDFGRMSRQRCVVSAIVKQVNPVKMLQSYQGIIKAAGENISSDVPPEQLEAFAKLVMKVQKGKMTSLPLNDKNVNTVKPDFDEIHAMIGRALDPNYVPPTPTKTTSTPSGKRTTAPVPSRTTPGKKPTTTAPDQPSSPEPGPAPAQPTGPGAAVDTDEAC